MDSLLPPPQILYISSRLLSSFGRIPLKASPHSASRVLLFPQYNIRNCSTYTPPPSPQALPSPDSDVCTCSAQEGIPPSLHTMICISLQIHAQPIPFAV